MIEMKTSELIDEKLIDAVLEQVQMDIQSGDLTAIEELLRSTPKDALAGFLSDTRSKNG